MPPSRNALALLLVLSPGVGHTQTWQDDERRREDARRFDEQMDRQREDWRRMQDMRNEVLDRRVREVKEDVNAAVRGLRSRPEATRGDSRPAKVWHEGVPASLVRAVQDRLRSRCLPITSASVAPGGSWVVTCGQKSFAHSPDADRLLAENLKRVKVKALRSVVFGDQGRIAMIVDDRLVTGVGLKLAWRGALERITSGTFQSLALVGDGLAVVTGGDERVLAFDAPAGLLEGLQLLPGRIDQVVAAPNGGWLLRSGTAARWERIPHKLAGLLLRMGREGGRVDHISISPSGGWLVVGAQ